MPLSGQYAPSPAERARKQAETYESTAGAQSATMKGLPVVVLTSVGAKSGMLRKTPLMRVEHDGEYAAIGSLGGAPKNPLWVHNIRKHPQVELQDGAERHDYAVRELTGAERDLWWGRAVQAYPPYADYQRRTSRQIPVFLLTRIPE